MEVIQKEIMPGVTLTALRTNKFKSSCLSVMLMAPMKTETVTENALLGAVLRRGCRKYPDMESVSAALDELCGGVLKSRVRQQGETQCIGLVGSFLDDAFSPDGNPILEPAADLMGQLLLQPVTENGVFKKAYVMGEGKNLADRIRAQINEKRQYSVRRLVQRMCEGEAYGLDELGRADRAETITPEELWERYVQLLRTAPISVYYCGSASGERVEAALRHTFAQLPERAVQDLPACEVKAAPDGDVRNFEDNMDVTQGKLALGWRTGGVTVSKENYPALVVLNALYGGTTTSKLFMNVREKLSLCYFASSMLDKHKGLMIVSSGIEFDKFEQAKSEILAQFEACKTGDFSGQELEAARRAVVSSLTACEDSQGRLEDYWLAQAAAGQLVRPTELARQAEAVTAEQVCAVAAGMTLDAVYFLKGKEG